MTEPPIVADALAHAVMSGRLQLDEIAERMRSVVDRPGRWLPALARRIVEHFGAETRPKTTTVARFIAHDIAFRRALSRARLTINWSIAQPQMTPAAAADTWSLPSLTSPRQLASWLSLSMRELDWLADTRHLQSRRVGHESSNYTYRVIDKRWGRVRMIEAPKPRLKRVQRQLLNEILSNIPPHIAAHGFRRDRSIRSFAAPHCGRRVVIKIDLHDFFPSIRTPRVEALFRTVGYPEYVARCLAGLCTNSTPASAWPTVESASARRERHYTQRKYAIAHLPQGAPTSPAIANCVAFRLDCRLSALAAAAGAVYTRYADDLAFSGDERFARIARFFIPHACAVAIDEGFEVHYSKTRLMRQGVAQRLVGLTLNDKLNIPRVDYDQLKATLTNCLRFGPETQNRDERPDFRDYLHGKIAFVESINPQKGQRLRELFDQINFHAAQE